MARVTIGTKRAELFREWICAVFSNNGAWYYGTLSLGVPDGDDVETVLEDLQDGIYDEDIDATLGMYRNLHKRYEKDGYYYKENLYASFDTILEIVGLKLPVKILKSGPIYK